MFDVAGNYRGILRRIEAASARANRDPGSVRLIAITKSVDSDRIRAAVRCGVTDIGENRLQEALTKRELLAGLNVTRHFIGHLQTNKARKVADAFDWVQCVDRIEVGEKLNQAAGTVLPILIEVKLHDEATKSGVGEDRLPELAAALRQFDHLDLRGLMAVPPFFENPEETRPYFRKLRELGHSLGLTEFSMGMSKDFEVAIEEGATMVRVGTALFGARS